MFILWKFSRSQKASLAVHQDRSRLEDASPHWFYLFFPRVLFSDREPEPRDVTRVPNHAQMSFVDVPLRARTSSRSATNGCATSRTTTTRTARRLCVCFHGYGGREARTVRLVQPSLALMRAASRRVPPRKGLAAGELRVWKGSISSTRPFPISLYLFLPATPSPSFACPSLTVFSPILLL